MRASQIPKASGLAPPRAGLAKRLRTSDSLLKCKCTFSSVNPPYPWNGAMYQPSRTLGNLIGGPKLQYLPPNKPFFQEGKDSLKTAKCTITSWKAAKENGLILG